MAMSGYLAAVSGYLAASKNLVHCAAMVYERVRGLTILTIYIAYTTHLAMVEYVYFY